MKHRFKNCNLSTPHIGPTQKFNFCHVQLAANCQSEVEFLDARCQTEIQLLFTCCLSPVVKQKLNFSTRDAGKKFNFFHVQLVADCQSEVEFLESRCQTEIQLLFTCCLSPIVKQKLNFSTRDAGKKFNFFHVQLVADCQSEVELLDARCQTEIQLLFTCCLLPIVKQKLNF